MRTNPARFDVNDAESTAGSDGDARSHGSRDRVLTRQGPYTPEWSETCAPEWRAAAVELPARPRLVLTGDHLFSQRIVWLKEQNPFAWTTESVCLDCEFRGGEDRERSDVPRSHYLDG
jgi:hypothetical protein